MKDGLFVAGLSLEVEKGKGCVQLDLPKSTKRIPHLDWPLLSLSLWASILKLQSVRTRRLLSNMPANSEICMKSRMLHIWACAFI